MSSLVSLSFLFLSKVVPTVLAHSSHAAPQLRLRQQQQHKDVDDVGHIRLEVNGSGKLKMDYGDLTCMKWTGGTCPFTFCKEERGPTECIESKCMCPTGYCSNAIGECEPHMEGEWLGTYAISFEKPYAVEKPYIGASPGLGIYMGEKGSELDVSATTVDEFRAQYPEATANSERQWKIALSPRAHVRFESVRYPGFVLSTLDNIPVLMPLEHAHPIYTTFRVRPTAKDGGGYEIWDPHDQQALMSNNEELLLSGEGQGVTECMVAKGVCDGHQLVIFEPQLPHKATPIVGRDILAEHGILHWWQLALLWLFQLIFLRVQLDSWEEVGKCVAVYVVLILIILVSIESFMYLCGGYCYRHPEIVLVFVMLLVCSPCFLICCVCMMPKKRPNSEIVETVKGDPKEEAVADAEG